MERPWLTLLRSKKRLERERGLHELKLQVDEGRLREEERRQGEGDVLELVTSFTCSWEAKHGGLMAACVLLPKASEEFCEKLKGEVPLLLEYNESRVRLAAGELVGALCRVGGGGTCGELIPYITGGIQANLERDSGETDQHPDLVERLAHSPSSSSSNLLPASKQTGDRPSSPTAADVFHDTAGWRYLETYMTALQLVVENCGTAFEPHLTSDLVRLVFTSLSHTNRFVRETGYKVISAIVTIPGLSAAIVSTYWSDVALHLAKGLSDSWSQVRMSSSVTTRVFLTQLPSIEAREPYLSSLLPPLCLNRHYVAEGVRLYCQETWKLVTEMKGVQLVEKYITQVVEFYISQSQAANHAVREAACACIAELGNKVSSDILRPHISDLVRVLLECFRDDSWLVRDAACLACGNFMSSFPTECQPMLSELLPLFTGSLEDSMPSVRQGAAASLATLVTVYGSDVEEVVMSVMRERLPLAACQPLTDTLHPGVDPRPAVFGVVRTVPEGTEDLAHTDQQMYSCGSLAPKMRRGGCMDTHFHKPAEPWEKTEGCIHLLAELSQQKPMADKVCSLLPAVAEAARHRHYRQHLSLLETVLRRLPQIAKGLGKRPFKKHIELFLDSVFYGAASDSAAVKAAAADCLILLSQHLGHVILRGRIEQHNSQHLPVFDSIVHSSLP